MRFLTALCAALSLTLVAGLALAQDKPDSKKTETKPGETKPGAKPGAGDEKKDPAKKPMDRGDKKAEALLKKAWERVLSAEASGLERLKAQANISVNASAFGQGEMPFNGKLLWKKGSKAIWQSDDEGAGEGANPLGNVSAIARRVFEPYLAYVTGFPAWDGKFKEASFKMGDPVKDDKGKVTADRVVVTFADDRVETFTVADNKVTAMATTEDFDGNKADMEHQYTYEDTGKKLRLSKVTASTKVDMGALPGGDDPKNPGARPSGRESLDGSIEIKKYGKAGEYDIAIELKGGLSFMGMEFPTKLTITEPKVNKDVTDADLKPLEEEGKAGDKPKEDDEF
ncbi:MAG: hypothetical protein HS108_03620 [Planctomycetes bacterium]|jgi:hypothetical protein|nr:hypothetical protein [Planctomycetota bacterium]MCL4731738.1 hypothetical protein [Planctomycetota bacterium]